MNTDESRLRIGIPKGSLQETTKKLFGLAGFKVVLEYRCRLNDLCILHRRILLLRGAAARRHQPHQGKTQQNHTHFFHIILLQAPKGFVT